ncbi:MAG: flavin reductase family protein [Gammaproteobacteria bacterium]
MGRERIILDVEHPIWDRFFMVAPLVLIGTREQGGGHDFAPKHMAGPMSWGNWFGFVCTPRHHTYLNSVREGVFTVSYPTPEQLLEASLAAAPRYPSEGKPALDVLETIPAEVVSGVLLAEAWLHLECVTERVVDDLGDNSLVIGRIVAASIDEHSLRAPDRDDQDLIQAAPLLAYLHPGRCTAISESRAFPFSAGMRR